ncbi:MAG: beta-N-acetylhexosaminidase [Bacteroidaceae bacterium]|nr:beta-N-acetylhexosaminidase [Bacteroidaceae bacterium]
MRTGKVVYTTLLFLLCHSIIAQDNISALIPMPAKVETYEAKKPFNLKKPCKITGNLPQGSPLLTKFFAIVEERTGVTLTSSKGAIIDISINNINDNPEAYSLHVTNKKITISGNSEAGIFYALQTLDQILLGDRTNSREGKIAPISIEDSPRYRHRAVMLDPARHFIPVNDIKFFIDLMARYKYNKLQLHLTDDQGWRIEIKSHPGLTEIGAKRNTSQGMNGPDNGYYTQEQLKDIIAYAADRYIEIIPEIDIPGHSVAILTTYPQLGCKFRQEDKKILGETTNMMLCANESQVYNILEDIIREIAAIFPSRKIHLGGDEAAVSRNWAQCDSCLALMKRAGYDEPSELMNIFFAKTLDIVRRYGKEAILWCELDNMWPPANDYMFPYPSDVTLVTWRNALTPKCIELTRKYGHKLIMAPGEHTYLDYPQWRNDLPEFGNWGMPITTLEQSYRLDPSYGLPNEQQTHIQGVMATMWAEAIKDINRLNYMFFPRGIAIAEAGWSTMEQRNWESFKERLIPNLNDLMQRGVSFRVPFEIYPRK